MKDDIKESVISSQFRSDDDNEDETTYNYDDEMFKETDFDDEVVAPGVDFIEDGKEWTWYNQIGDTVHIDFDNWAVWEAHEKDEGYPAYFIVDVDTGFIDWGPCDTKEEAADFLDSKQSDEEDIDFSITDYEDDYYVDESVKTLKEEKLNLDSTGKKLKKLTSQLVLDSDEELRDYVNKIVDEVIEERNNDTKDESLTDSVDTDSSELNEDIDLSSYEEVDGGPGYWTLYRKFKPGMKKAEWAAKHQNTGEVRKISYKQATGEEPIEDSPIKRLARDAGKELLPSKLEDIEDKKEDNIDVEETNQKYTSAKTSINSSKLPAIFKMIDLEPGTINLDFGGGKFDNVAEYLADKDVTNLVYDPYNRSSEHNKDVVNQVRANGGADSATISNVLNVIAEETARNIVLNNVYRLTKPDASVYITVYEGDSSGNSGETKSEYQLNRKTADYVEEIEKVFPNVVRKGNLIIAKK